MIACHQCSTFSKRPDGLWYWFISTSAMAQTSIMVEERDALYQPRGYLRSKRRKGSKRHTKGAWPHSSLVNTLAPLLLSAEALQIDRGRDTEAVWTDPFLTDPFEANVTTGDEVHRSGDICNNAMMMTSPANSANKWYSTNQQFFKKIENQMHQRPCHNLPHSPLGLY